MTRVGPKLLRDGQSFTKVFPENLGEDLAGLLHVRVLHMGVSIAH